MEESTKSKTLLEFEIKGDKYTFEELQEIIKKICAIHEGKRELRIKVSGLA